MMSPAGRASHTERSKPGQHLRRRRFLSFSKTALQKPVFSPVSPVATILGGACVCPWQTKKKVVCKSGTKV